jgi:ABC-2 type transport system ATP-binding protein
MSEPAVEVTELVKRYPKSPTNAVDGLSFAVERGEVFGLLGPNGAGKTTTVGVLTTRVLPTSGAAMVSGIDVVRAPVSARSRFAVVPQRVNLDRSLTVRYNLIFHAAYHGVPRAERGPRADALLERMGLADKANDLVDKLSGGQTQRVMIARGLMHRPEVLFLDEPTTGLDPQARLFVHDQVLQLRSEGVTVLLTTHDMEEAAKLADRVGIVDHGKLLALDTPHGLIRSLPGSSTVEVTVRPDGTSIDELTGTLSELAGVQGVERLAPSGPPAGMPAGFPGFPGAGPAPVAGGGTPPGMAAAVAQRTAEADQDGATRIRLYVDADPAALLGPVVSALTAHGAAVTDLSLGEPSLEDVFISLTGRELR